MIRVCLIQIDSQYSENDSDNDSDNDSVLTSCGPNQISPFLGIANRSCTLVSIPADLRILGDSFPGKEIFPTGVCSLLDLKLFPLFPYTVCSY